MPAPAQAKILRAIETREITPVGGETSTSVECNIIAASNRNLVQMVTEGEFRQDLLYRLNVVQFQLPPLRERPEDIALLADHFLVRFAAESGGDPKVLAPSAIALLKRYSFPGNVRELKNLMERVNIYCVGSTVTDTDLAPMLPPTEHSPAARLKDAVNHFEHDYIQKAIAFNNGNIAETARQLGLERSHLYKKLRKFSGD